MDEVDGVENNCKHGWEDSIDTGERPLRSDRNEYILVVMCGVMGGVANVPCEYVDDQESCPKFKEVNEDV